MCKKIIFLLIFISPIISISQTKYWVFFDDKKSVTFNPYEYFDSRAIERRLKNNIPIDDISDYPLNQYYVKNTANIVDSVGFQSRWFNAVVVCTEICLF